MEYLLWLLRETTPQFRRLGLNPYCYGISSLTSCRNSNKWIWRRLNPYCYGISSLTVQYYRFVSRSGVVLILIVMEYLLWRHLLKLSHKSIKSVLILIVMEYLLWHAFDGLSANEWLSLNPYCYGISSLTRSYCVVSYWGQCLNPYCYGISSLTDEYGELIEVVPYVLILIVMEYLLWLISAAGTETSAVCLNPYCYGISSLTYWLNTWKV